MISKFAIVFVAILVCSASAQLHRAPVVSLAKKGQPTTAPKPIDESNHRKECPAGFNFVGKQCAKTLTELPSIVCPRGLVLVDGKCVSYVGKESECPIGYVPFNGLCQKTLTAPPSLACPPGYILKGKDLCVMNLPLPEKSYCPAGTVPKGDNCATSKTEAPEYVCPSGYTLIGKRCQREETFDCTPPRVIQDHDEPSKKEQMHIPLPSKGKDSNIYRLPASKPLVEEYVILKTCKRIITEAARPVCPKGGSFDGKLCKLDVLVAPLIRPGGFEEKSVRALSVCPEGYIEGAKGECFITEEILPDIFCPGGTVDLGDKCAIYSNPKTICPDGFFLDGKICTKTIFAAPLVEFTVTYACTGKDCGRNH